VLWAKASQGPEHIALSHETALPFYGISDAEPITHKSNGSYFGEITSEMSGLSSDPQSNLSSQASESMKDYPLSR
jgi:hypothetical protein